MGRLLVVDDEPDIVEVLRTLLEFEGHEVQTASDGAEALRKALDRPDSILLDVMLPGMTGWDVCATLKSDPKTSDIPVIMVSARTQREDVSRGREVGAEFYITKPFDLMELVSIVNDALESSGGQDTHTASESAS